MKRIDFGSNKKTYIGGTVLAIVMIYLFQNCSKGFVVSGTDTTGVGTVMLSSTGPGSSVVAYDAEGWPIVGKNGGNYSSESTDQANSPENFGSNPGNSTTPPAAVVSDPEACVETRKVNLFEAKNSPNFTVFEQGVGAIPNKGHEIEICKKFPKANADIIREDVGLYRFENYRRACPGGFHPMENLELAHIASTDFEQILHDRGQFFSYEEGEFDSSSRLFWTFDSVFTGQRLFTNGDQFMTSEASDLALPVICVRNHRFSRNGQSVLKVAGCDRSNVIQGLNICAKPTRLFKDYSKLIEPNTHLNYKEIGLKNYHDIGFDYAKNKFIDRFPAKISELVCPVGFEFPTDKKIVQLISENMGLPSTTLNYQNGQRVVFKQHLMRSGLYFKANIGGDLCGANFGERCNRSPIWEEGITFDANFIGVYGREVGLPDAIEYIRRQRGNNFSYNASGLLIRSGGDARTSSPESFNEVEFKSADKVGTYCVKKDANFKNAMLKFSGCEKTLKAGNLNMCAEISSLSTCPEGFHPFSAQEYKANFNALFKVKSLSVAAVSTFTNPEFPFGGDYLDPDGRFSRDPESWFFVDGLKENEMFEQQWVHNGGVITGGNHSNGKLGYQFSPTGKKLICIRN